MILDAGLANLPPERAATSPGRIVVLQPRRVAARTVAARVAWERKGRLGDEVGYQIRFEDRLGPQTRICFLTEGVFLRWLEGQPDLPDVAVILFDEFHERNLLSDVALGLVKRLQETARPDLKIAVMSATLEAAPVAKYLAGAAGAPCPILESAGQSFPVEVRYLAHQDSRPITDQAAEAAEKIVLAGQPGDILIFMPGAGEIATTVNAVRALRVPDELLVLPLHGELPGEEQDRAFAPSPFRKVVVATNVAETSVTIDGIRHVIDSGQARIARFDAERGVKTLFIEAISRASADQRKGRAGRTAPGQCLRLWTESGQLNRPERNTPEIQRSDLAEVVLLLHSMQVRDAAAFDWLDRPDPTAVTRAENLLRTLGALASQPAPLESSPDGTPGRARTDITPLGRKMLKLPIHPRYARMLLEAAQYGCVPAAALCAALVSGRDILMRVRRGDKELAEARELFEGSQDSDFFTLIRAYQFARKNHFQVDACRRYGIHAQTARQVELTFEQILDVARTERLAGKASPAGATEEPGRAPNTVRTEEALCRAIMTGFIDQLCVRRDEGTLSCDLTQGRSGTLMRESVVQRSKLLVAATLREIDSAAVEGRTLLGLATAVQLEWIAQAFPDQVSRGVEHLYDRTHKRVRAVRVERFQDLVIHFETAPAIDQAASGRALAEAFQRGWFELPLLDHEVKQFIARVGLVARTFPELGLRAITPPEILECLGRAFAGLTLAKEAQATPLRQAFFDFIGADAVQWVNELAPPAIPWFERRLKLLYPTAPAETGPPEAQVRLQECFPLIEHPKICDGKVPVKLWLCAPDGKRLESTSDWPHFKAVQYPKLRGSLLKKYPGVAWL